MDISDDEKNIDSGELWIPKVTDLPKDANVP